MLRGGMAPALALLTACAGAAPPVAAPEPAQALPTLHVLTIGVEHYLDRALRQEGAEGDAIRAEEALLRSSFSDSSDEEEELAGLEDPTEYA